jgi:phage-related protein
MIIDIAYTEGEQTMEGFETIFYDKPDGTEPAKDFLDTLDKKMRAKVLRVISMLELCGTELREPYSKHLSDGIFELRAQIGSDISRVLYFFLIGRRAILTNGFIKKTDKTPPAEINKAKTYRSEYVSREGNKS